MGGGRNCRAGFSLVGQKLGREDTVKGFSAGGKMMIGAKARAKDELPLWLPHWERSHVQLRLPDVSLWAKACTKTCPEAHL